MNVIEQLIKVQEISNLLEAYEEELRSIPSDAEQMIDDLKKKLDEAKKVYHERELEFKKSEGELEIEREKLKEKEELLLKGGLKAKELQSLEEDVNARRKHIQKLETELTSLKEELESIKERIATHEATIKEVSERIGGNLKRREELTKLIEEMQSELENALEKLPEDAKNLFLTLKKIYKYEVIAPVEVVEEGKPKYYCSACSIQLSKSEVDSLKRDKKSLHTCPYCGRIIYFGARER